MNFHEDLFFYFILFFIMDQLCIVNGKEYFSTVRVSSIGKEYRGFVQLTPQFAIVTRIRMEDNWN
jgi:hypothetical protein